VKVSNFKIQTERSWTSYAWLGLGWPKRY